MVASYASDPASILAVMGPSIGPDVYEVGRSVVEAAWENLPGASKAIRKNSSGKLHFDLWEANRQVLLASGLKPENVDPLGECTYTLQEHYFSARREGIETGRLVSGIMLAG